MFKKLAHALLLSSLLVTATAAHAQDQPAAEAQPGTQLAPEQTAKLQRQNTVLLRAAMQIVQLVDQQRAGTVWDGASSIAKQAIPRTRFISQLRRDRAQLGALQSRTHRSISRVRSDGKQFPAGYYVNVIFASRFANAAAPVRELVSFHLDDDKVWRVSGYTLR